MTQAITTKFLGPTNSRGARVKAQAGDGGPYVVLSWDYGMNQVANHGAAAFELASQLGWLGAYVDADLNSAGRVYVRAPFNAVAASLLAFHVEESKPMSRTVARGL